MKQRLANLIPPQRLMTRQRRRHQRNWLIGLSAHLILLIGISIAARNVWSGGSLALADDLADCQKQSAKLNLEIIKHRKAAADKAAQQTLMTAISDSPNWNLLLKLVDQSVSDDITVRQSQVQETADHQYTLAIHGAAQSQSDVSQFVLRLQQSGLFKDIRLNRSERELFMNNSAISFDLACPIDGLSGALP